MKKIPLFHVGGAKLSKERAGFDIIVEAGCSPTPKGPKMHVVRDRARHRSLVYFPARRHHPSPRSTIFRFSPVNNYHSKRCYTIIPNNIGLEWITINFIQL
jgi:hypothetical protein